MLPVTALLRRADTAAVVISALAAKAKRGFGFRRIAADLTRPAETVRGWLRRLSRAGRGGAVDVHCLVARGGPGSGDARAQPAGCSPMR